MMHGGGMTWGPSAYDPELNLYYFGTGNPQPVIAGRGREGANLYTESIIALNPIRESWPGTSRHRRTTPRLGCD
jgi:alcohol dehydrogenase (cytochrome c)